MTNVEKNKLLTNTFEELWRELWGDYCMFNYKSENKTSKEKFIQIKRGVKLDDKTGYNLEQLIILHQRPNYMVLLRPREFIMEKHLK